jgi:hypothetical protein
VTNRFSHPGADTPESERLLSGAARSWARFWFAPRDPLGLHAVRVLAGLLFLSWLLVFAGHQEALFGLRGWFDLEAYRETVRLREGSPAPITWSVLYLCGTNATLLTAVYWASIGVLFLFTIGVWPRLMSVLTWVVVASFSANPAISYPGDYLLLLLAFYLMLGYLLLGQWSQRQSALSRILGTNEGSLLAPWLTWQPARHGGRESQPQQSHAATLALRLLQVHFAIVVVTGGLHKLQFGEWWSGAALWYPMNPTLEMTRERLSSLAADAATRMLFISVATYVVLAWQLTYPLFAWRPRWRVVLLVGAVLGWAGSVFLYREPVFGPVLLLASLAYLTPAEWRWTFDRLARLPGLLTRRRPARLPRPQPAEAGART